MKIECFVIVMRGGREIENEKKSERRREIMTRYIKC